MTDKRDQQATAILNGIRKNEGGHLKIFLGAAPGVGKTYAMLCAAQERRQQGEAVLIGLVETHGRSETERLLDGFEILPRKHIRYRNHDLTEFDLDGALQRRPRLILVDELAHTNIPGSRHKRRYQDLEELLAAGIDVYTTLNIQHLVSLNDLVLQITGIRVRETVPDRVVDAAHDIVFVDLPSNTLIERLQQGKVYLPEYAASALKAFFSPANLTALRELAMREVMKRVDAHLKHELDARAGKTAYVIREKMAVLIGNRSDHEYLIRIGRQIADRRQISWTVVWVDTGAVQEPKATARLHAAMALTKELGGETEVLKGPNLYQAIVPYVSRNGISAVLLGPGSRPWWRPWRKRLYHRLIRSGLPLEVTVYAKPDTPPGPRLTEPSARTHWGNAGGHVFGALAVAAATALAVPLAAWVNTHNLVLAYVLAVVVTGLRHGSGPAVQASVLAFLCFNFFLTEPRYTFEVARRDELATLIFLFLIALVCGPAASRIRRQFILLREANRYSEAMRLLGQELSVADDLKAVWRAVAGGLAKALEAECCILSPGEADTLSIYPKPSEDLGPIDHAAIEWTRKHGAPSGRFTDTLAASVWTAFPLIKDKVSVGVALLKFQATASGLAPYDKELIAAMLRQGADTWRRIQLVSEVEAARMKTEVEQLRSALLSSVSHDLKSPLSAMIGAAESLRVLERRLRPGDRRELVDTILLESRRLESYIQNLLDMTRLGHGALKIERDWVSVADILGSAMARLKRYFPGVRTEYHSRAPEPLIHVHAALIEQALFNILENAAKFSPPGESIRIRVEQRDNRCVIEIEDRGPGIPEPLREQIFDMFYVVSSGDRKKQNTGMGLAICRGMIAAHGGTVRALAGAGQRGTRIVVDLPVAQLDPADRETRAGGEFS